MGGLRLVVAQTVEDEPLCKIEPRRSHSCDETATIDLEIKRTARAPALRRREERRARPRLVPPRLQLPAGGAGHQAWQAGRDHRRRVVRPVRMQRVPRPAALRPRRDRPRHRALQERGRAHDVHRPLGRQRARGCGARGRRQGHVHRDDADVADGTAVPDRRVPAPGPRARRRRPAAARCATRGGSPTSAATPSGA